VVRLSVADTGIGIAEEDIPKAFAEFGQASGWVAHQRKGFGLGLPISKAIVEAHGGVLTLASKPGAGTVVTMELPQLLDQFGGDTGTPAATPGDRAVA
jgi:signal transduction histidine kinase